MAIIILLTAIIVFLVICGYLKNVAQTQLHAVVSTLVVLSAFVVITTELLNVFNLVATLPVFISWLLFFIIGVYFWFRNGKYMPVYSFPTGFTAFEKKMLVGIAFILIITGVTAVVAYPNNWDSMTYHLGRVMQWIQHGNVNHYPTRIDRQLTQPPLAEYEILHLLLLSNNDRLANLIQWVFFGGCISVIVLLATAIGFNKTTTITAAFLTATIPMAILQSTGTQNDIVVAFFVLMAILFAIKTYRKQFDLSSSLLFYIICALALLSKGTAFIYLFPVVIGFGILLLYKKQWRAFPSIVTGVFIVALFYFPFAYRNYQTYTSPLGKSYELNNEVYALDGFLSNIFKNSAMHLGTPFQACNQFVMRVNSGLHQVIGVDVNAPKYNWGPSPDFQLNYISLHEDSAGNLLQVIGLMIAIPVLILRYKRLSVIQRVAILILLLMYCTFCFVLKWQVWHVRLHLTMFLFGALILAMFIQQLAGWLHRLAVGAVFCYALLFLFFNQSRGWFFKTNIFNQEQKGQYFASNKNLYKPFADINFEMHKHNCSKIAFISGGDSWEYPFWKWNSDVENFEIYQINTNNETAKLEATYYANKPLPDAIINVREDQPLGNTYTYKSATYALTKQSGIYNLYIKQ